jgi:hypothetical protein
MKTRVVDGTGQLYREVYAKTKEGERIYCLDGEFELKYPEKSPDLK